ncbi:hypothetical protein EMCG_01436 [[Emmonsia] crescens]|uniref:Uncharacterized protein n=1 Tax=[Emmonsia] crescens TaxID=73230 RepID=A0A0G2J9T8_9EURO|nr:hypothetical protein EMCG_01436 [Emmonsia crescens UAMH 3008]
MMISKLCLFATLVVSGRAFKTLPPTGGSWYAQPTDISEYKPGVLIRSRQVENKLQPLLPPGREVSVDSVYQYLFRTMDSLGDAVAAATTLIVPHNSDPSKLLVFQAAYDAADEDCSPSYTPAWIRDWRAPGILDTK